MIVFNGSCEFGNIIFGSIILNVVIGGIFFYILEVIDLDGNFVDVLNLNEGSYIVIVWDVSNCLFLDIVVVEGGVLFGGIEE